MTLDMLGIEARARARRCRRMASSPILNGLPQPSIERVRAVVLISPNNPTGAVYPPEVVRAIFRLCRERGVALVLDETYRDFLSDAGTKPHGLFDEPDWQGTLVDFTASPNPFASPATAWAP